MSSPRIIQNKGETFKLKMCTILEKENNNKQNKTEEGDVKEEVSHSD